MKLPEEFIISLENTRGFDKETFKKVHDSGEQITSIRINPNKFSIENCQLSIENKIPWTDLGYYLFIRPSFTFDPLFHTGCYYVQEASSMFLEQALQQTVDLSKSLKILDLCAAPGGKSTHIQSMITKDSLLVSNEVIKGRSHILKDNILKWGSENVVVTNNDPKNFSKLENYFDVIIVDAPCSGSGLFRRDKEAIEEWSLNNVQLCSQRQQRIIADVWPALKNDGVFIFCTCSYSKEEDEDISAWVLQTFSSENIQLSMDDSWNIIRSSPGYRFWPDKLKGEGFYIHCFRKKDGDNRSIRKTKFKPEFLSKKETELVKHWVNTDQKQFIRKGKTIYAVSEKSIQDFTIMLENLNVIYMGVGIGETIRDKLIPEHALAMSSLLNGNVLANELNYDDAIRYLQKKDLQIDNSETGWQLVTCNSHNLGWINVLPNRINNYYPNSLRILKEVE